MTAKTPEDVSPRVVRPGACTWCSHDPHAGVCKGKIRTDKASSTACPCSKRAAG